MTKISSRKRLLFPTLSLTSLTLKTSSKNKLIISGAKKTPNCCGRSQKNRWWYAGDLRTVWLVPSSTWARWTCCTSPATAAGGSWPASWWRWRAWMSTWPVPVPTCALATSPPSCSHQVSSEPTILISPIIILDPFGYAHFVWFRIWV